MKLLDIRKLQKRAVKQNNKKYNAYLIYLPKEWVEKNKLKRGEFIEIYTGQHGELILVPKKKTRA